MRRCSARFCLLRWESIGIRHVHFIPTFWTAASPLAVYVESSLGEIGSAVPTFQAAGYPSPLSELAHAEAENNDRRNGPEELHGITLLRHIEILVVIRTTTEFTGGV
jgi:hypothetical protein